MTQVNTKPRIEYIDIAKGILIMCLLFGHILFYAPMDGVEDKVMHKMHLPITFYNAFFMQSFFIITGVCSSFRDNFKNFFQKNVKTLLLPSILLFLFSEFFKLLVFSHSLSVEPFNKLSLWLTTGAPWFIMAMFLGRLLYWPIYRLPVKSQIVTLSFLYITGLIMNLYTSIPNYLWYQHTLLLTPYLFVGSQMKVHSLLDNDKFLKYLAIGGFAIIFTQMVIGRFCGFVIPSHDYTICIKLWNFPIHIINSITGTALVLWVSKNIAHCRFLSTLGTGTLLIYLWNGIVYRSIIRLLIPFYNPDSFIICALFHVSALLLCYVAFYFIVVLIYNHKSLNWIVGKW